MLLNNWPLKKKFCLTLDYSRVQRCQKVRITGKHCGNTYSINTIVIWSPMVEMGGTDNIHDGFVRAGMDDEATAKQKSPK
jgi:hypothetical protein